MQRIDRTHATQNHRCIQQRIDPTQTSDEMVTENANSQCNGDKNEREQSMAGHAPGESRATQQWMVSTFVHRMSIAIGFPVAGSYLRPADLGRCDKFPDIREVLQLFFRQTQAIELAVNAVQLRFSIDRTMKTLNSGIATKLSARHLAVPSSAKEKSTTLCGLPAHPYQQGRG